MRIKQIFKNLSVAMATTLIVSGGMSVNAYALSANNNVKAISKVSSNDNNTKNNIAEKDVQHLKNWLKSYGADEKTIHSLIEKYIKGETWDSMTNSDKYTETTVENKDGTQVKRVYSDGSISIGGRDLSVATITVVPEKTNPITPNLIDPGTVITGSGYTSYKGAKIYSNTGIINAWFYADFYISQTTDGIDRMYDAKVLSAGGYISDVATSLEKVEAYYPAEAKLSFTFVSYLGIVSGNCWLRLRVGGNSYSTGYSY